MSEILISALLLGLAGSLHCVGMCGPIVLALPLPTAVRWRMAFLAVSYHVGRILTYGVLGLVLGILGAGFALAGLQKVVSMLTGLWMFGAALWYFFPKIKTLLPYRFSANGRLSKFVTRHLSKLLKSSEKNHFWQHLKLGMLNGLLPCGMVYLALAGAVSTSNGYFGGLYMMLFGLGTMPLMVLVSVGSGVFSRKIKSRLQWLQPTLMLIVGVLIFIRG